QVESLFGIEKPKAIRQAVLAYADDTTWIVIASNSKVQIKTDSAAAILAIRDVLSEKSFNKGLKRKNRTILDKITEIVHFKSLNLELLKIKAYS
ncbi:5684_t:CDS:2, partial [Dentiscutata heterogama]